MSLLQRINRPQDLHALSDDDLVRVAEEVRSHIIDTVGEIGGHFGRNLGTCELAVALHSLLDSPRDKILWDVGHQAYPHKVLTGRRDQLPTIRKYEGLAPFCSIAESEHDIMGAGHASTSIGYAVGLKEDMCAPSPVDDGKVVAVIGDGAMTGGVAFEAIHQAGGMGLPLVVVLNDNGMSIAPNVGALSRYFTRVRLKPKLWHTRENVETRRQRAARPRSPIRALRPEDEGVDQGVLGAGPALGGARLGLHRRHRRPRRARPAPRAAQRAGRRAPGARPHRHRQGQGLRARRGRRSGGPGALARGQAEVDHGRRRGGARDAEAAQPAAAVHDGLRRGARQRMHPRPPRRRHHRGHEHRHRAEHPPEGDARALLRRRHRRAAGDPLRRRARAGGRQTGRRDLRRRPSCSAPTTRSCTTSAYRNSTSSSRSTVPASSATTARRTTASSTSPTCARCRTSS